MHDGGMRSTKHNKNNKVCRLVCWLVVVRIYIALAIFQPYRELESGDNQSLKS